MLIHAEFYDDALTNVSQPSRHSMVTFFSFPQESMERHLKGLLLQFLWEWAWTPLPWSVSGEDTWLLLLSSHITLQLSVSCSVLHTSPMTVHWCGVHRLPFPQLCWLHWAEWRSCWPLWSAAQNVQSRCPRSSYEWVPNTLHCQKLGKVWLSTTNSGRETASSDQAVPERLESYYS